MMIAPSPSPRDCEQRPLDCKVPRRTARLFLTCHVMAGYTLIYTRAIDRLIFFGSLSSVEADLRVYACSFFKKYNFPLSHNGQKAIPHSPIELLKRRKLARQGRRSNSCPIIESTIDCCLYSRLSSTRATIISASR